MTVLRTHLLPVSPVFLETELDRVQGELVHAALAVPHRVPQSPILGAPKSRSSSLCLMFAVMGALYQPVGVATTCERCVRSEVEACVTDLSTTLRSVFQHPHQRGHARGQAAPRKPGPATSGFPFEARRPRLPAKVERQRSLVGCRGEQPRAEPSPGQKLRELVELKIPSLTNN